MSKLQGYKIVIQVDSKTIVGYRTHEKEVEADMVETTTGASTNQWKEFQPLFKGMTMSAEGLYDPTSGANYSLDDVEDLLASGTAVTLKWGGTESGDRYAQISAYTQRIRQGASHDDFSDYTVDFQCTGEPTYGTV